jgi:DNA-binding XRE family transcriptional regulator
LTQEEFAEAFGISVLTLREREHGSPESGWAICVPLQISSGVN